MSEWQSFDFNIQHGVSAQSFTAVLERIVYYDEASAYCVAEVRRSEEAKAITIQGRLPGVQCGET